MVIGISTDKLEDQVKFTDKENLNFPLYSDAEQKVTKAFGVLIPGKPFAQRVTFIIDKKGIVQKIYPKVADARKHPEDVLTEVWILFLLETLADKVAQEGMTELLFSGKELTGWKVHPHHDPKKSKWSVVSAVKLKEGMPTQFKGEKGTGVLLNGEDGHGVDFLSETLHGDCQLHIEFAVSKNSNSGVYFQGQYELQILDSFGKKDKDLTFHDCGGIYTKAPPRKNACKAPGEWQTYDVVFQAPRFDATGKKTANAKFIKVVHNGVVIHDNVEVDKPTTAALGGPEKPRGPLMLQGDHGPVAFRNIMLKPLGGEK